MPQDHYRNNELPPLILNYILPFLALDIIVTTSIFPIYSQVTVLSPEGTVLNFLPLDRYTSNRGKHSPVTTFCQESGYIFFSYANVITVWDIHKISNSTVAPIRAVKGLEAYEDPIIGLNVLYYNNTIATVTKSTVKFWDMEEVIFSL